MIKSVKHVSESISFLVRHGAEKAGLTTINDGCIKVNDILRLQEFRETNIDLEGIKTRGIRFLTLKTDSCSLKTANEI